MSSPNTLPSSAPELNILENQPDLKICNSPANEQQRIDAAHDDVKGPHFPVGSGVPAEVAQHRVAIMRAILAGDVAVWKNSEPGFVAARNAAVEEYARNPHMADYVPANVPGDYRARQLEEQMGG